MKLKDILSLTKSAWRNPEDGEERRLRIDIVAHILIVSYMSDCEVEMFLKEELFNREVIAISAPEKNVIMIQIEEE